MAKIQKTTAKKIREFRERLEKRNGWIFKNRSLDWMIIEMIRECEVSTGLRGNPQRR